MNSQAILKTNQVFTLPFWRPTVNVHASCTVGLEFESREGQMLLSVANGSPLLQHLCKRYSFICQGTSTRR